MGEHIFTAVDAQSDPSACIGVLDRIRSEPSYAEYKARIAVRLDVRPGRRYLDVGCGTGADAAALAARTGATVVGIDASQTMVDEAVRRGVTEARVADAAALPFAAASFDGCWADRTFQHLVDPAAALAEMIRVTRPSGRVLVVDPDYDTQVVDIPDQALARRVLRYRADRHLRNGTLAHQLGGWFVRAGLAEVAVEVRSVLLRDPTALDHAMGLRSWARSACEAGVLHADEVGTWERSIDAAAAGGHFLYAFSLFITTGVKP